MSDLSRDDPMGRFTGLAEGYARHRPDYPAALLDQIIARCGLQPKARVIDVGSGTGISSRLFSRRGFHVIGIEPNADMRARAAAEAVPNGVPPPEYRDGRAEATGLPDDSADVVLAAQAFHWFDAPRALQEFHRILAPKGWVVLMANERDESDPFTKAYGDVFRTVPETAAVEGPRAMACAVLSSCPLFVNVERVTCSHAQELDEEGVLGRAFSATYAPRDPAQAEPFAAALRRVFAQFQHGGRVLLRYQASAYLGQRKRATL